MQRTKAFSKEQAVSMAVNGRQVTRYDAQGPSNMEQAPRVSLSNWAYCATGKSALFLFYNPGVDGKLGSLCWCKPGNLARYCWFVVDSFRVVVAIGRREVSVDASLPLG